MFPTQQNFFEHEYALIPVSHFCGLVTAVLVLFAFLWDRLRSRSEHPTLAYCFVAALLLWFAGTIGVETWLYSVHAGKRPPPQVLLTLLKSFGVSVFFALRIAGVLLPAVPLALATRYRYRKFWVPRYLAFTTLSILAWLAGNWLDHVGPRFIPLDFEEVLGEAAGNLVWRIIRCTTMTGLGWSALAFWCIWYFGVFREKQVAAVVG
jgi:hypothetical protein